MADDDRDVLDGFLNASRYVSKDCYQRYGFDSSNYTTKPTMTQMCALKERLRELIRTQEFRRVSSGDELIDMLGRRRFRWVRAGPHVSVP